MKNGYKHSSRRGLPQSRFIRPATVLVVAAFMLSACKPENCPAPTPVVGGHEHPWWVHKGVLIIKDMALALPKLGTTGVTVTAGPLTCPLTGDPLNAANAASGLLATELGGSGDSIDPTTCSGNEYIQIVDTTYGNAYLFTSKGNRLVYYISDSTSAGGRGDIDYWLLTP